MRLVREARLPLAGKGGHRVALRASKVQRRAIGELRYLDTRVSMARTWAVREEGGVKDPEGLMIGVLVWLGGFAGIVLVAMLVAAIAAVLR